MDSVPFADLLLRDLVVPLVGASLVPFLSTLGVLVVGLPVGSQLLLLRFNCGIKKVRSKFKSTYPLAATV